MNTKPTNTHKQKSTKSLFSVSIGRETFETQATDSGAAISKAAYRYAAKNGIGVGLVQWKIREGELVVDVKGGEKNASD